jgi:hypothetical protein
VKTAFIVLMGSLAVSAPAQAGVWGDWDCSQKAPREATVDAAGAREVRVIARAGALKIHGRDGATSVAVHGTACSSSQDRLQEIKLVAERRGDVVYVEAAIPEYEWFGGARALDLDIEVPSSIALDVDDGSGSAEIRGVASLKIEDGSGELTIDGVKGGVAVDDGSGSLEVANVGGEVRVKDGSGEIVAHDVGSVLIEEDGSGGVRITRVRGNVRIRDDGSGSISVRDVAGDFTVDQDGSGSIDHHDVRGRVRIPSDE